MNGWMDGLLHLVNFYPDYCFLFDFINKNIQAVQTIIVSSEWMDEWMNE